MLLKSTLKGVVDTCLHCYQPHVAIHLDNVIFLQNYPRNSPKMTKHLMVQLWFCIKVFVGAILRLHNAIQHALFEFSDIASTKAPKKARIALVKERRAAEKRARLTGRKRLLGAPALSQCRMEVSAYSLGQIFLQVLWPRPPACSARVDGDRTTRSEASSCMLSDMRCFASQKKSQRQKDLSNAVLHAQKKFRVYHSVHLQEEGRRIHTKHPPGRLGGGASLHNGSINLRVA